MNAGSKREGVFCGHWSRARVRVSGAERESGSSVDDDLVGLQRAGIGIDCAGVVVDCERAGYSFPEVEQVDV